MKRIRQILLLLSNGKSQNAICKEVGCSKRTVSEYSKTAAASGFSLQELLAMADSQLAAVFNKPTSGEGQAQVNRKDQLDELMPDILKWLRRPHAHLMFVYEDFYRKKCPDGYGYTQFKMYVKEHMKKVDFSFHNEYEPGCQWQIDFAGDPLYLTDRETGERIGHVALVCVLPYSNTIFMIALPNATTEWFFYGLNKGLQYLGALPKVAHTDNMRQWVSKTERYSLKFSDCAREWALYYGIEPTACRVRKPRDKGPVEGAVNQAYKYIYARLEGESYNTLESLNRRISELLDQYNALPYKGSSRWDIYLEDEKPKMKELPLTPYTFKMRKVVKLTGSYHVCVGDERHFYSCPHRYVGQKVTVMWSAMEVEIYLGYELICVHTRDMKPYAYTTIKEHMPPKHEAYIGQKNCQNAASFIERGRKIGPYVGMAIEKILDSHIFPQQGYNRCQGVLSLPKTYGNLRVDNACRILIEGNLHISCKALKDILKNKRDLDCGNIISTTPYNDYVRGPQAFVLDDMPGKGSQAGYDEEDKNNLNKQEEENHGNE